MCLYSYHKVEKLRLIRCRAASPQNRLYQRTKGNPNKTKGLPPTPTISDKRTKGLPPVIPVPSEALAQEG